MYIPKDIISQAKDQELKSVVSKFEDLDYRYQSNYEKLCAEYRKAYDSKNTLLADELYALMRKVQKARPKKNVRVIIAENKAERRAAKERKKHSVKPRLKQKKHITPTPAQQMSQRKLMLLNRVAEEKPSGFSSINALKYFYFHRKQAHAFLAAEFAVYFDIDMTFAEDYLKLATKMTILRALSNGRYFRQKANKIDDSQLYTFVDLPSNQVHDLLVKLITETGPIEYLKAPKPLKKRGKHGARSHNNNDKTRHYESPTEQSYSLEIDGGSIDSMREVGHGRKKSREYTNDIAMENNRSRYGLNDEPILDYDLD